MRLLGDETTSESNQNTFNSTITSSIHYTPIVFIEKMMMLKVTQPKWPELGSKHHFDLDDLHESCEGDRETKSNDTSSISIESCLTIHRDTIESAVYKQGKIFECATSIGLRDYQEDRVVMIPELFDQQLAFAGVFDGTSGKEASQFASQHIVDYLMRTSEMREVIHLAKRKGLIGSSSIQSIAMLFERSLFKAFKSLDRDLLIKCEENNLPYVASTAVTALLHQNLLTIAHLGDSRACIFKKVSNTHQQYMAEWLTVDHKPNAPREYDRIKKAGGLVTFRGVKPYLREGDYLLRQQRGERPKQINYSRAFGAINLKKFGLSAIPDVNHFQLTPEDKFIVIASDGLWDSLQPAEILSIILTSQQKGEPITQRIIERAVAEMPNVNVIDNVSVIVIQLE